MRALKGRQDSTLAKVQRRMMPVSVCALLVAAAAMIGGCGPIPDLKPGRVENLGGAPELNTEGLIGASSSHVMARRTLGERMQAFSRDLWQKKARRELPDLNMAVFGDSLGAATFAGTRIGQQLRIHDIWNLLRILSLIYQKNPPPEDQRGEQLASVLGYESFNGFSGEQVWSHRSRIGSSLSLSVKHTNFSLPGAHTTHLLGQVERFEEAYLYSPVTPSYVVFSIGGNDFCDEYPADRAVENLEVAIRRLRRVAPQALVLISGMPDVVDVYRNYDRLAFRVGPYKMSCRQRVEVYGMCARERALIDASPDEIAAAKQELKDYEIRFANLAKTQSAIHPNEGPVVYAPVPPIPEDVDVLAADCFHPGVDGHHMIAEATWPAVEEAFIRH